MWNADRLLRSDGNGRRSDRLTSFNVVPYYCSCGQGVGDRNARGIELRGIANSSHIYWSSAEISFAWSLISRVRNGSLYVENREPHLNVNGILTTSSPPTTFPMAIKPGQPLKICTAADVRKTWTA
jgi:hypothetical protein